MKNIYSDALDDVQVEVLADGVDNVRSDHSLVLRYLLPCRAIGLPPHQLQRVIDTVHCTGVFFKIEPAVTELVLCDTADVARHQSAATGSLAIANRALNGRVGVDRYNTRA